MSNRRASSPPCRQASMRIHLKVARSRINASFRTLIKRTIKAALKAAVHGAHRLPHRGSARDLASMTLDLSDEETAALVLHLREAVDYARRPLAPRLDPLKAILAKARSAAASRRNGCHR